LRTFLSRRAFCFALPAFELTFLSPLSIPQWGMDPSQNGGGKGIARIIRFVTLVALAVVGVVAGLAIDASTTSNERSTFAATPDAPSEPPQAVRARPYAALPTSSEPTPSATADASFDIAVLGIRVRRAATGLRVINVVSAAPHDLRPGDFIVSACDAPLDLASVARGSCLRVSRGGALLDLRV
jgi:hypothetical protein